MLLLTALLVLAPGGGRADDPPKSVLILSPPWINVFRTDSVTLNCGSPDPSGDVTQWFHNGTVLGIQTPSYSIQEITFNDSGEYRCRTGGSALSDPVRLDVYSDWLLLQATGSVFLEGEPVVLRCHSWKNHPLYKVIFYQDGKALKFFHQNSNFSIPRANQSHSGSYFCSGSMGHERFTSSVFNITVRARPPEILPEVEVSVILRHLQRDSPFLFLLSSSSLLLFPSLSPLAPPPHFHFASLPTSPSTPILFSPHSSFLLSLLPTSFLIRHFFLPSLLTSFSLHFPLSSPLTASFPSSSLLSLP
uniref:Ig-like domain-containing protein n=1 Tax=Ornithorhynchus anatinus TaxID=9258 RepID=F6PW25_ORNAN